MGYQVHDKGKLKTKHFQVPLHLIWGKFIQNNNKNDGVCVGYV